MIDRLTGIVLLAITVFVIFTEWHGPQMLSYAAEFCVVLFLILAVRYLTLSRRIFVVIGMTLFIASLLTRPDWPQMTETALKTAAFIAAFFAALTFLRNASGTSPAIERCGIYLAEQPPGRRYAALTAGGYLFALVLNYGAISLLGSLAEANARREPNAEIRGHRIRRMLLAIQRGFASTLCWSPLAFAMAISLVLVPGATWLDAVGPCFISSLIMVGLGWALDTIFKPRLSAPPPPRPKPTGTWTSVLPMLILLGILGAVVGGFHLVTGIRSVGVVLLIVPLISIIWIAIQNAGRAPLKQLASRSVEHAVNLAGYRPELVLLMMAGFIGTLGSRLLSPLIIASGFDLTSLPGWLILISLVWLIPLSGLIGANPILSVSLMAPLLPDAAAMGVTPASIIVAITAGWALGGASSPYTATTMIVGRFAGVTAWHVGTKWNGLYTLISGVALSAWVAIVALA